MLVVVDRRWARVGEAIKTERRRLGYRTQHDLAARAGVSQRTISRLESGTRVSDGNIAAVEAALGWEPGTVDGLARGRAVQREVDEHLAALHGLWPRLDVAARRALVAAARVLSARR